MWRGPNSNSTTSSKLLSFEHLRWLISRVATGSRGQSLLPPSVTIPQRPPYLDRNQEAAEDSESQAKSALGEVKDVLQPQELQHDFLESVNELHLLKRRSREARENGWWLVLVHQWQKPPDSGDQRSCGQPFHFKTRWEEAPPCRPAAQPGGPLPRPFSVQSRVPRPTQTLFPSTYSKGTPSSERTSESRVVPRAGDAPGEGPGLQGAAHLSAGAGGARPRPVRT